MKTTFYSIKLKKKIKVISQQYEVGLYVAWYFEGESIPQQVSHRLKDLPYHTKLRKEIIEAKDKLLIKESTVI